MNEEEKFYSCNEDDNEGNNDVEDDFQSIGHDSLGNSFRTCYGDYENKDATRETEEKKQGGRSYKKLKMIYHVLIHFNLNLN